MLIRTKERPSDKVVLVCEKPEVTAKTCALVRRFDDSFGAAKYVYSRNGVWPDAAKGAAGLSAEYEDQKDEPVNMNGTYTFYSEQKLVTDHGQLLNIDDCSVTIAANRRVVP